ncbi:MAG TPA: SdpI family protein [Enterococcus sp.]|nr:SdpI family protein [Enterococcus sp.]
MIFLYCGGIFLVIGLAFLLLPAKMDNLVYGYRSYLSKQSQAHWAYAQKLSARFFLFVGFIMTAIGFFLNYTHRTNFFIVEIVAIPWFIALTFGCIETKLKKFDLQHRGEEE